MVKPSQFPIFTVEARQTIARPPTQRRKELGAAVYSTDLLPWGSDMAKRSIKLAELESIVRAALRSGGFLSCRSLLLQL